MGERTFGATADAATCPTSLRSPEPVCAVSAHPGDGQAQGHVGSYDDPATCYNCRRTIATAPKECDAEVRR